MKKETAAYGFHMAEMYIAPVITIADGVTRDSQYELDMVIHKAEDLDQLPEQYVTFEHKMTA